jgi:hypothetical protein
MIERLEWITGPSVVTVREMLTRHGVQTEGGPKRRLLVGQLRDKELGIVHAWVMAAPHSAFRARVRMERYWLDIPRSENWTISLNTALPTRVPRGFKIPNDGEPFERGLII